MVPKKTFVAHRPEAPRADPSDVADAPASPEPSTTTPASTFGDSESIPASEEHEASYPACGSNGLGKVLNIKSSW